MKETLLTVPRNGGEELRIALDEYKGRRFLSFRVWYNAGGGEMRPGKQGCTVSLAAIEPLQRALEKAATIARTQGDIPPLPDNVTPINNSLSRNTGQPAAERPL